MTGYLSALGGAGWQFLTDSGNPLAGGNLYTYAAGTTTPATTYSTRACTPGTENANPIKLDAYGRPPQEVWFNVTTNYKLKLETSTGGQVWIKDNIPGIAAASDLAAIYVTIAEIEAKMVARYATRAEIKALTSVAGLTVYLTEAGREGEWIFRAGDFSDYIAADTQEGLYLKADDTAASSGAWVRTNTEMLALPEWFGAVGDAKKFNWTTGKWDNNASATNDTVAVNAALQWAQRGLTLRLSKWYGIYPTTSGSTVQLTSGRPVADGMIVPLQTYVVVATGGATITYNGTVYSNGQTFVGVTWDMSYTASAATASVYEQLRVGALLDLRTSTADSNYRRYVSIDTAENAGLLLCQAGCAIAVLGSYNNDSMVFNSRFGLQIGALETLDGSETMGFYLAAMTFRGETSATVDACNIGGVFSNCWNMSIPRLNYNGAGIGYVGFIINNANNITASHVFTHYTKVAGNVTFPAVHGAAVGNTIVVNFNGTSQFTGTVTKINSTTQLTCDKWVRSGTTTLRAWTATINGGAETRIVDGKSTYGISVLASNSEGFDMYCDFQNHGGYGLYYVTDSDTGNSNINLRGYIEGPSNPVRVTRSASLASTEALSSFYCNLSMISGRATADATSGSDYGEYAGVDLDYVASGIIGTGEYHSREYIPASQASRIWKINTVYAFNDVVVTAAGVYRCTTAGTSAAAGAGPTGAYPTTGIVDNTCVWTATQQGWGVAWTAATVYAAGNVVVQTWGVYQCTTGGTSAAAGARGPDGTGSGITDGTVTWAFVRYCGSSVRIRNTCEGVGIQPSVHNTNNVYSYPVNLQIVQDRVDNSSRQYDDANSGQDTYLYLTNVAASVAATRVVLPTTLTGMLNEKRPVNRIQGRLKLTFNTVPAAGANTYFDVSFSTDNMSANNVRSYRVTAAEIGGATKNMPYKTFDVDIPVSEYRDFLYTITIGAGVWQVDVDLRVERYWF